MPKKISDASAPPARFYMKPPSIVYWGLLNVDATLNGRTQSEQARGLLQAKLATKETQLRDRVEDLARIHEIDPQELWDGLFTGKTLEDFGIATTLGSIKEDDTK